MAYMALPSAATAANYALIPGGAFYRTRNKPVLGVVLHITAGLQDLGLAGRDDSAEGTVKWALGARVRVSWHAGADTDGVVLCLPDTFTAWHAAGVNSPTVGLEISKLNVDWTKVSDVWKERTLRWAAHYLAAIVAKHKLPMTLQTSEAKVKAAIAANQKFGFVYHSTTSSGTRSDPGKNFPIETLFAYIREALEGKVLLPGMDSTSVAGMQQRLGLTADGSYGPATEAAVAAFQKANGLRVTGMAGGSTLARIAPSKPKPTPTPTPVGSKEINVLFLVKIDGTHPVYKGDGFRRQHIGPKQLVGLQRAGLKIIEVLDQTELDAYGELEANPKGQK